MKVGISKQFIDLLSQSKGHALSDQRAKSRLLGDAFNILFMIPGYENGRRHNFQNGYEVYMGPGSSRIIVYVSSKERIIVKADKHDTLYDGASYLVAEKPEAYVYAELSELAAQGFAPKHEDKLLDALLSFGFPYPFVMLLDRLDEGIRSQIVLKEKIDGALEVQAKLEKARKEATRLYSQSVAMASFQEKENAAQKARAKLLAQQKEEEKKIEVTIIEPVEEVIVQTPAKKEEPSKALPIQKTKEEKIVVDPAALERAILRSLEENYKKQIEKYSKIKKVPLRHAILAPNEFIIKYTDLGDLFKKLERRVRRSGLKQSREGWLILLATTVPEDLFDILDSHYPGKVKYTDDPKKGKLETAIIIKKAKPEDIEEADPGVKKVKTKTKQFEPTIRESLEQEDELPDFLKFFLDEDEEEIESSFFEEEEETAPIEIGPSHPKHWHCYVCGKKKLYHDEPAKTITLTNGKTAYLCKKHKNAL